MSSLQTAAVPQHSQSIRPLNSSSSLTQLSNANNNGTNNNTLKSPFKSSSYSPSRSSVLLSFGGGGVQDSSPNTLITSHNNTPITNKNSQPINNRPTLGRYNTVDSVAEPRSLSYLHKPRYSDLENNPFLISQERRVETSSNTNLNKLSSYSSKTNTPRGINRENAPKSIDTNINASSGSVTPSNSTNNDLLPLIRKKTGEIVKSSLKLSSLGYQDNSRSAQSLPTTPTYKSVHFNNKSFVDVKYFREKDSPTTISAETSPTVRPRSGLKNSPKYKWLIGDSDDEDADNDSDSDLNTISVSDDDEDDEISLENLDWELYPKNFDSTINYDEVFKKSPAVLLERFILSTDKKFLKGQIMTKNIAFQKKVVVKYSLNNWKIVSEVEANYVSDIPRNLRKHNYDRFVFQIPLVTLIEDKIIRDHINLFACVKYETDGKTFWDNNSNKNYELLLKNTKFTESREKNSNSIKPLVSKTNNYYSKYLNIKKNIINSPGLIDRFSLEDLEPSTTDTDEFDGGSVVNNQYNYDDHDFSGTFSRFSNNKDSYFPPFDASPNTPNFKYPANLTNGQDLPNYGDLGEPLVSMNDENARPNSEGSLFQTSNTELTIPSSSNTLNNKAKDAVGPLQILSKEESPSYELRKVRDERPSFDSESYKELVQNYCFFKG